MIDHEWLADQLPGGAIDILIYTVSIACRGQIRLPQPQLADFLNIQQQAPEEYLSVHEATVEDLHAAQGTAPDEPCLVHVRRDSIVLLVPAKVSGEPAQQAETRGPSGAKAEYRVRLGAYPFSISGTVQVGPNIDLPSYLHRPFVHYLPITDATVMYIPARGKDFRAPLVMVSKSHLQVVTAQEAMMAKRPDPILPPRVISPAEPEVKPEPPPARSFGLAKRLAPDRNSQVAQVSGSRTRCLNCQRLNHPQDNFCLDCGIRLTLVAGRN